MKIDPKAEILGRETVAACIARDLERVIRAMDAMEEVPPKTAAQAVEIYAGVGRAALLAIYKGGVPNELQNHELAGEIVASETWTKVTQNGAYEVLESLCVVHTPAIPVGEAGATLFVVVGYLLAIYCEPLGFTTAYEFLDALLTELEKA
jgi:hypothetical protein